MKYSQVVCREEVGLSPFSKRKTTLGKIKLGEYRLEKAKIDFIC